MRHTHASKKCKYNLYRESLLVCRAELMYPPPQPIVSEFNWSVLTVAVLHTAVCPRDRAEMGVSV